MGQADACREIAQARSEEKNIFISTSVLSSNASRWDCRMIFQFPLPCLHGAKKSDKKTDTSTRPVTPLDLRNNQAGKKDDFNRFDSAYFLTASLRASSSWGVHLLIFLVRTNFAISCSLREGTLRLLGVAKWAPLEELGDRTAFSSSCTQQNAASNENRDHHRNPTGTHLIKLRL